MYMALRSFASMKPSLFSSIIVKACQREVTGRFNTVADEIREVGWLQDGGYGSHLGIGFR
jgi:hypothetical protein